MDGSALSVHLMTLKTVVSMIQLELYELKNLCMEMSELGVANYVKKMAPGKDMLSQRQAYADYGETKVRNWVRVGLVVPTRLGSGKNSKKAYSKAELIAAKESEKLHSIINHN